MKFLLRLMPFLFFAGLALVTLLALIPGPSVPSPLQFWDKAQHSIAFAVLAVTGCLAFPTRLKQVCLGLLTHGALIELMQSTLTASRVGDAGDWLADGIGVVLGASLYLAVSPVVAAWWRRGA
jgi:VanZ family protein